MHRLVLTAFVAAALAISCASSPPDSVAIIGEPEDLVPLTGEWVGTYDSEATGSSGSITFHLTDNPKGAHGDVLLAPKREFVRQGDDHPRQPFGGSTVLSIEFVRIAAGEISGKIAAHPDPADPGSTVETHFAGHLEGEWIEGTFVTYSDRGLSPRRGTWRAHRQR